MQKHNVLKSGNFHMHTGDILHLIFRDETGTPVTIDLVSTPEPGEVIEVVPGQVTVKSATDITSSSFSANWNLTQNTVGYYLDVATDSAFTSFVTGYENKALGYVDTCSVTGLEPNTYYYYRVRAINNVGLSVNSETITVTTLVLTANDWFLPSKDELDAMYNKLHAEGVGGFVNTYYWSSSEEEDVTENAYYQDFSTGIQNISNKIGNLRVRACRHFTTTAVYSLRQVSPYGGYVFHIIDNGGGSFTYYECMPIDQGASHWSNILTNIGITAEGTTIGTGEANTVAIIGQVGHTASAAKLCSDLIT